VVTLTADIQPIHGEEAIEDQDYPVVIAYNVDQATEIDISAVDYSANEVTLADDPADTETVKLWPVITEGTLHFRGLNQFGQIEGYVYPWSTPLYRWHDFKQLQRGREVNLHGSIEWTRYEVLQVVMDSPRQIVWEDADYPQGEFVSTFEQDVEIAI
jgi:hypothetical protein